MQLEEFAARLRASRDIVFFTGAGISTESGVLDFRSPGGIWTRHQLVYFDEFMSSEAARVRHWKLKKETHELYKTVKPNVAHYAIRRFEEGGQLLGLITQNVDGLHSLAGVSDERIVELHGTDRTIKCLRCQKPFDPEEVYRTIVGDFKAPTCDACGGFLKPRSPSASRCPYRRCSALRHGARRRRFSSWSARPCKFNPRRHCRSSPNPAAPF